MKKTICILSMLLILGVTSEVFAKHDCHHEMKLGGGYIISAADVSTVKDAKTMEDDAIVTLQGNIEKRIKKNVYLFRDATGDIMLKIKNKIWQGQSISAQDTVQVTGELDKEKDEIELKVESIIKK